MLLEISLSQQTEQSKSAIRPITNWHYKDDKKERKNLCFKAGKGVPYIFDIFAFNHIPAQWDMFRLAVGSVGRWAVGPLGAVCPRPTVIRKRLVLRPRHYT